MQTGCIKIIKSINTLVEDIQSLFSGKELLNIASFSDKLGSRIGSKFKEHLLERKPYVRLSAIGRPLRQQWYELHGFKGEPLSPDVKMKFLFGDILEELLLFLAEEAGHSVEKLQEKVELHGVSGSIDAIIDGVLIDSKSASTYSWNKFANKGLKDDDPFGYYPQIASYSKALGGLDGGFLVIDKTLGKLCLDLYSKEELAEYDSKGRIEEVRRVEASDSPPERCYPEEPHQKSGNMKLGIGCSFCGHKTECWKDSNDGCGLRLFLYSDKPVWLTKVVNEPRVFESKC